MNPILLSLAVSVLALQVFLYWEKEKNLSETYHCIQAPFWKKKLLESQKSSTMAISKSCLNSDFPALAIFDLAWEHSPSVTTQDKNTVLRYSPTSEHTILLHFTLLLLLPRFMSRFPQLQKRTEKHFMIDSGNDWQNHRTGTGIITSDLSINFGT